MIIIFLLFIFIIPIVLFFPISRSIKANPIKAVKITGIVMLLYGLYLLLGNTIGYLQTFHIVNEFITSSPLKFFMLPFLFFTFAVRSKPLLLLSLLVGLIYTVSGLAILRKKNWGKVLALSLSFLLSLPISFVFVSIIIAQIRGGLGSGEEAMGYGLLIMLLLTYLPSLLFLIFLPFLEIKEAHIKEQLRAKLIKFILFSVAYILLMGSVYLTYSKYVERENRIAEQDAQRILPQLHALTVKDALSSEDIVWLEQVANSKSKWADEAITKIGMTLMAHPGEADKLIPLLIKTFHKRPKLQGTIVALLGGSNIRVHPPVGMQRDIALIAPEFASLKHPDIIITSSGGPPVLPEELKTNEEIIHFLCSVGKNYPKLRLLVYLSLGRFRGETAYQCLAGMFDRERDKKMKLVLANSLLRHEDVRGLTMILIHLRNTGEANDDDIDTIAAIQHQGLIDFVEQHLKQKYDLFQGRYLRGDDTVAPKLLQWTMKTYQERNDESWLFDLLPPVGDRVYDQNTDENIYQIHFVIPFLIKVIQGSDRVMQAKAVDLLNTIAKFRSIEQSSVAEQNLTWQAKKILNMAQRLPYADLVTQDAAGWKVWYENHQTDFVPSVAPLPNCAVKRLILDNEAVERALAEVERSKSKSK